MRHVLICLSVILSTSIGFGQDGVKIFYPGIFDRHDVEYTFSNDWWVMCKISNETFLKKAKVKVEPAHNPWIDSNPNDKSGVAVKVENCKEPLLLVHNERWGKERKLKSGEVKEKKVKSQSLVFDGKTITVKEEKVGKWGFKLTLAYNEKKQTIYSVDSSDGGGWGVDWIGDVDGDKKFDLIIGATPKYSVGVTRLYLSGLSSPNMIVKPVANISSFGQEYPY